MNSREKTTILEGEAVTYIPLSELHPFPNHPFKVRDDDAMSEMTESIMEYGILTPAIVRPRDEGGYEIVAGHRRKHACELAGLDTLPAIVRELDSDMATILMVDSNIQREEILPSEKAQAYKMKLEAIKRQGARTDRTCDQVGHKLSGKKSVEIIADESGESKTQVQRYIRLTALSPQLQLMVDDKEIAVTPAVELSYLKPEEQQMVTDAIAKGHSTPSLVQAQQLKKISRSGGLDTEALRSVMTEGKNQSGQRQPAQSRSRLPRKTLYRRLPRTRPRNRRPSSWAARASPPSRRASRTSKTWTRIAAVPRIYFSPRLPSLSNASRVRSAATRMNTMPPFSRRCRRSSFGISGSRWTPSEMPQINFTS